MTRASIGGRQAPEQLLNERAVAVPRAAWQHAVDRLGAGFDVFALTSDTEQMPLSLMEAMASGLPVVSTDVGDVRAMLAPENLPWVGARDDTVVADLLASLLADRGARARVGAANRAKAERDFDQEVMFNTWRGLWTGLA